MSSHFFHQKYSLCRVHGKKSPHKLFHPGDITSTLKHRVVELSFLVVKLKDSGGGNMLFANDSCNDLNIIVKKIISETGTVEQGMQNLKKTHFSQLN